MRRRPPIATRTDTLFPYTTLFRSRDAARWRCTIAGAGVYDLPMMRDYDQDYIGSFGANYLAKGASSLADVSPARNTDGEWAPILIVHGVRDPRVPIAQARTLVPGSEERRVGK